MTIPIYLQAESGDFILTEDGYYIIVGYIFDYADIERPRLDIPQRPLQIGIEIPVLQQHSLGGINAPARSASTTTMESATEIMESASILMGGPLDWSADASMKSPVITDEKPTLTIDRELIMMDNPFGIPE